MRYSRFGLRAGVIAAILAFFSPLQAFAHEPFVAASGRDCSRYDYAPPFPAAPANYKPHYHTLAQRFLNDETDTGPVTPSEYFILDSLLDEAKASLKPSPNGLDPAAQDAFAIATMQTIDCILVRHGFVYPGIGLVALLSDGLDPTMFPQSYYNALLMSPHNAGRGSFIVKRGLGPFYVVDCDVASYIYLAIGEMMHYPMKIVDMPGHNFIRWIRRDGTYIDFETMDGMETDDAHYVQGWGIDRRFLGKPGMLTTMTDGQLAAYHDFSISISMSWKNDILGDIAELKKSIAVDATLSDAANNLSWLYAAGPQSLRNGSEAVHYGLLANAILADGDTMDTLACAYGQAGDFVNAVKTEQGAIDLGYAPAGSALGQDMTVLSNHRSCQDPGFGSDPRPFRPNVQPPAAMSAKDTNVLH